jgi:hypothetical protein
VITVVDPPGTESLPTLATRLTGAPVDEPIRQFA